MQSNLKHCAWTVVDTKETLEEVHLTSDLGQLSPASEGEQVIQCLGLEDNGFQGQDWGL